MPDVGIEWSVSESGIDDFESFIEKAQSRAGDMRDPLDATRDYVQTMITEEFLSDGERSGGWAPLTHEYDLWKINRRQYDMLQLAPKFLHGDPGTPRDEEIFTTLVQDDAWTITPTDALFAPESTRAAWHQAGAAIRKRGGPLPARPVLVFLEEDYAQIEDYFEQWMQDIFLDPAFPGAIVGRSTLGTFLPLGPY